MKKSSARENAKSTFLDQDICILHFSVNKRRKTYNRPPNSKLLVKGLGGGTMGHIIALPYPKK